MGKKYIIDLNPDCVEGEYLRIPARIAGEEQWLVTKAALTPYTAPDLEQVRKEAYEEGYAEGSKEDYDEAYLKGYNQGLEDAWECARKIIHMPEGDLLNIFTECYSAVCTSVQVFLKYDASEAIEKIRQYEQERDAEIKVGDVVRLKNAPEIEIWVTDISDEDGGLLSGLALKTVGDNCDMGDTYANRNIYNFERTGKHYDVPNVLEKMREE